MPPSAKSISAPTPVLKPARNRFSADVYAFLAATLIGFAVLVFLYRLWAADLSIPFHYNTTADVLVMSTWIKGIAENGWHFHNPALGAPFGLDMYDFPVTDSLHFLIIRLISTVTDSYGLIINGFYLLGFILTIGTSLVSLRMLGLARPFAVTGALLFAFLPYHFLRGQGHIFFSSYYLIPLAVLVMIWVMRNDHPLLSFRRTPFRLHFSRRAVGAILICIAVGCGGTYYAFFCVLLMVVAGLTAFLRARKISSVLVPLLLISVITATLALNLIPTALYVAQHGRNAETAVRSPAEAEVYGLKIIQLLVPPPYHRIELFRRAAAAYNTTSFSVTENYTAALGVVGSLGFMALLMVLVGARPSRHRELLTHLSTLNIAAVLIGSIGGFGSVFAYIISPLIRAYCRISIIIGFFAVVASVVLLEALFGRLPVRWKNSRVAWTLCGVVLAAGLFDQTSAALTPNYESLKAAYALEEGLIHQIEPAVGSGGMIFQLPHVKFPESGSTGEMQDYDLVRAYLHSKTLKWSYGAMRGRFPDAWLQNAASRPVPLMLRRLSLAGYSGIYIDRLGYPDHARSLEFDLTALLQQDPIARSDGRISFFDIRDYASRFRSQYREQEWASFQERARNPLYVQWVGGCSGMEGSIRENWRWCGEKAAIQIDNTSNKSKVIVLTTSFSTGYAEPSKAEIQGPGFHESITIDSAGTDFKKAITVPPGRHKVRFTSTAQRVYAPGDPRTLVFRLNNFQIEQNQTVSAKWAESCRQMEDSSQNVACRFPAAVDLFNRGPQSSRVLIAMKLRTHFEFPATIEVSGSGVSEKVDTNQAGVWYTREFQISPGSQTILLRLSSNGKRQIAKTGRDAPLSIERFGYMTMDNGVEVIFGQ